jgi:iron complex outermembrane receptor protein
MYETPPLTGDTTLMFRLDSSYLSRMALDTQAVRTQPQFQPARFVPAYWLLNGRVALRHIKFGGVEGELAVWGKNLTDERKANFALIQNIATSVNFIAPRTYGADLSIEF